MEAASPSSVHAQVYTHANTALRVAGIVSEFETHPALQEAGIRTPPRWWSEPMEISPRRCTTEDPECVSFSIFTGNQLGHTPSLGTHFSLNHQPTWLPHKHTACETRGPSVCRCTQEQELKTSPAQGHVGRRQPHLSVLATALNRPVPRRQPDGPRVGPSPPFRLQGPLRGKRPRGMQWARQDMKANENGYHMSNIYKVSSTSRDVTRHQNAIQILGGCPGCNEHPCALS